MMATMVDEKRDQLARLVRDRRAELGRSLAQVVAASGDQELHPSWINRLELGQVRETPKRDKLAALARGLDLPFQTIARAAGAQFIGIEDDAEWSQDGDVRVVVARMNELSPEDRLTLARMAEAFATSRRPHSE